MGLPKKKGGQAELGKGLMRKKQLSRNVSARHTTADDSGSGTVVSITENTSIDEFLSNAEAAQRSFEAERGTAAIAVSSSF